MMRLASLIAGLIAAATPAADAVIRFESGASQMTADSRRALDVMVTALKTQAYNKITIIGHTDRHGDPATNARLSTQRAQVVADVLAAKGLDLRRMQVVGAGGAQPLSAEASAAADQLNRRVEIWVGAPEPIARVSWIHALVQARRPLGQQWAQAELDMPLRKLSRVRTRTESATEVTFETGSSLYVGAEALVVIYGAEQRKRAKKTRSADVRLEGGSVFARLAAKERGDLLVDTEAAQIAVQSTSVRIGHDAAAQLSTVSVYAGTADVAAESVVVTVEKGYGTRIKTGTPPEKPRTLLEPPSLTTPAPIVGFVDQPIELAFQPKGAGTTTIIDLGTFEDAGMLRPIRSWGVFQHTATLGTFGAGAYRVRLTSVDADGIVGLPSSPVPLIVLPVPRSITGRDLSRDGDVFVASKPGTVQLPQVVGLELAFGGSGAAFGRAAELPSGGDHALTITAAAGEVSAQARLTVRVASIVIEVLPIAPPKVVDGTSHARVELRILDGAGEPVHGVHLRLVPNVPKRAKVRRLTDEGADGRLRGPFLPCDCEALGKSIEVGEVGDGLYRFDLRAKTTEKVKKIRVVIFEKDRGHGRSFLVPLGAMR